jgi:hypothetical protein
MGERCVFEVISGKEGNLGVCEEGLSFFGFAMSDIYKTPRGFAASPLRKGGIEILYCTADEADFFSVGEEFFEGLKHFFTS